MVLGLNADAEIVFEESGNIFTNFVSKLQMSKMKKCQRLRSWLRSRSFLYRRTRNSRILTRYCQVCSVTVVIVVVVAPYGVNFSFKRASRCRLTNSIHCTVHSTYFLADENEIIFHLQRFSFRFPSFRITCFPKVTSQRMYKWITAMTSLKRSISVHVDVVDR